MKNRVIWLLINFLLYLFISSAISMIQDNLKSNRKDISLKVSPRLMVVIDEINMGRNFFYWSIDLNTTETEFMNVLQEKKFKFVDKQILLHKIKKDIVLSALKGDASAASAIGTQAGVDILILGKAVATAASGGPPVLRQAGMVSCQATVNLRAVRADDGLVLATASHQSAAPHIDRITGGSLALKKAARETANDIASKIIQEWKQDEYRDSTIHLRLLNVDTYSDVIKLKNLLSLKLPGLRKVIQREYSAKTVVFELDFSGSASQIAEEITGKDFSPYQFEIDEVTHNTIVVKINKRLQEE
jgi:hypothetical protein